jgi:hypothetical protein
MHATIIENENYDSALKVFTPPDHDEQLFNDLYKIVFKSFPLEETASEMENLSAASAYLLSSTLRRFSLLASQAVPPSELVHGNDSSVVSKLADFNPVTSNKTDSVESDLQEVAFHKEILPPNEWIHEEILQANYMQSQRESGSLIGSNTSETSNHPPQTNESKKDFNFALGNSGMTVIDLVI